jgi:NDP-sugar pyrophosphorylase family protein
MPSLPKIAILAGGLATRLRPLTVDTPKALVLVAGEPFAFHQLRLLQSYGFRQAVFLIGYLGDQIIDAVGDGSAFGMSVDYVSDGATLLGTGGALARALPELGDPFAMIYGDSWLEFDYAAAVEAFHASGKSALMTIIAADTGAEKPNVEWVDGQILKYGKANRAPAMRHVDYGFSVFHACVFKNIPKDKPTDLATIQSDLADRGDLAGFVVDRRYLEIGNPEGRQALEDYLLASR